MDNKQIDHDRLFKELLQTFFSEFMQLFFPAAHQAIDFSCLKFLQQELYTDITAGEKHVVDILVETRLKEEPGLILVHVEPQAYRQKDFNERMFIYFSRLFEKYRRRILPVAIFSYDRPGYEPDRFDVALPFLDVLHFQYYTLELRKLNWRNYITADNPVAAALLGKMGFKQEEKVKVKLEFMRMLARLKLDPARTELLGGFFETYLKLNREEERQLHLELSKLAGKEAVSIMEITTSWHEKGRAEGLEKGIKEGEMKKALETARLALKKGLLEEVVAEITGLELEAVSKLKAGLN